jgi:hypothetical protein
MPIRANRHGLYGTDGANENCAHAMSIEIASFKNLTGDAAWKR